MSNSTTKPNMWEIILSLVPVGTIGRIILIWRTQAKYLSVTQMETQTFHNSSQDCLLFQNRLASRHQWLTVLLLWVNSSLLISYYIKSYCSCSLSFSIFVVWEAAVIFGMFGHALVPCILEICGRLSPSKSFEQMSWTTCNVTLWYCHIMEKKIIISY